MNPTVCCVMLANGREAMVRRAIRCFRAQTYQNKRLLIWNTGDHTLDLGDEDEEYEIAHVYADQKARSIGTLRNEANQFWNAYPIICHWDSDDWSHPDRLSEQVALLQSSGKECVGYNQMLFWRDLQLTERDVYGPEGSNEPCDVIQESWMYRLPLPCGILGTSLMYWRRAWEKNPFADKNNGEDQDFLRRVSCQGVVSLLDTNPSRLNEPRMIASIHGSNTASQIDPTHSMWTRTPEWDARVREIMEA